MPSSALGAVPFRLEYMYETVCWYVSWITTYVSTWVVSWSSTICISKSWGVSIIFIVYLYITYYDAAGDIKNAGQECSMLTEEGRKTPTRGRGMSKRKKVQVWLGIKTTQANRLLVFIFEFCCVPLFVLFLKGFCLYLWMALQYAVQLLAQKVQTHICMVESSCVTYIAKNTCLPVCHFIRRSHISSYLVCVGKHKKKKITGS